MVAGDNAGTLQTIKSTVANRAGAPAGLQPKDPIEGKLATITKSGDASTTVFTYAHGLSAAPSHVFLQERNAVSQALHNATWDATNVTITFAAAPATGTNNIVFSALLVY